jgi:hypothetical protein
MDCGAKWGDAFASNLAIENYYIHKTTLDEELPEVKIIFTVTLHE